MSRFTAIDGIEDDEYEIVVATSPGNCRAGCPAA